jgi:cell wall-associated NlpC family hydrolase
MSLYEKYTVGYEGVPYKVGRDDCYGLARRWLKDKYGVTLTNYARPFGFEEEGLNLLTDFFQKEGFVIVSVPFNRLEIGDGLIMRLANRSGNPNHVGVYVGNGYMLHHLYNQKSVADPLTTRWTSRVVDIYRHPDVTAKNQELNAKVDILNFLPPHLKAKYERASAAMESAS